MRRRGLTWVHPRGVAAPGGLLGGGESTGCCGWWDPLGQPIARVFLGLEWPQGVWGAVTALWDVRQPCVPLEPWAEVTPGGDGSVGVSRADPLLASPQCFLKMLSGRRGQRGFSCPPHPRSPPQLWAEGVPCRGGAAVTPLPPFPPPAFGEGAVAVPGLIPLPAGGPGAGQGAGAGGAGPGPPLPPSLSLPVLAAGGLYRPRRRRRRLSAQLFSAAAALRGAGLSRAGRSGAGPGRWGGVGGWVGSGAERSGDREPESGERSGRSRAGLSAAPEPRSAGGSRGAGGPGRAAGTGMEGGRDGGEGWRRRKGRRGAGLRPPGPPGPSPARRPAGDGYIWKVTSGRSRAAAADSIVAT